MESRPVLDRVKAKLSGFKVHCLQMSSESLRPLSLFEPATTLERPRSLEVTWQLVVSVVVRFR